MNRETIEKWVLLDEAGELDALRRWLLRRALARTPELQTWRTEVAHLREWTRQAAEPVPPTPRDVMAAILAAGEPAPAPGLWVGLRPAWAVLAVLLLGIAAWLTITPPPGGEVARVGSETPGSGVSLAWEDGLDDRLSDLYVQLQTTDDTWGESVGTMSELDAMAGALLSGEETQI
jgi:predicted transcriptional regulator